VALEGRVGGAGDGLSHVGDAVDHVPMVVVWDGVTRRQARVRLGDGEEAVDLVGDRGGEDGHALVPVDGLGEVVVPVRVVYPLEAHSLCIGVSIGSYSTVVASDLDYTGGDVMKQVVGEREETGRKKKTHTRHQVVPLVQRLIFKELGRVHGRIRRVILEPGELLREPRPHARHVAEQLPLVLDGLPHLVADEQGDDDEQQRGVEHPPR
jgi:hypothetical protein